MCNRVKLNAISSDLCLRVNDCPNTSLTAVYTRTPVNTFYQFIISEVKSTVPARSNVGLSATELRSVRR